ncbi:hypothetical protein KVV02_002410 [Mortierella alpina]|uniref:WD40 repeat-like protein n=1 Tax=Mortierella alpina TaxID=64518 RepID=A0A9P8A064_MORAP|nr:hypothetical protein KVV02_002410 [Mortierella alpina]
MSPSLPPPPRKLSSSGGSAPSSARYPTVNPNSLAASDPLLDQDDDDDLDQALAQLLGQSHINSLQNTSAGVHHHPHCKHHGDNRPLSITSISSLGSGSYSSYGSTHSRRVSQAYMSPLSPALSEPSGTSYFSTLPEEVDEACPTEKDGHKNDTAADAPATTTTIASATTAAASTAPASVQDHQEDMKMAASSFPSCTYCSSVRSNSICSSGTQDDKAALSNSGGSNSNLNNHLRGLGLNHHQHRNSLHHPFYENNRHAVLKEFVPTEVRHRLSYHLDECWFVHFSPSGKYLASTGLDQSILLWQNVATPEPTIYKTFEFSRSITNVEWSPDSKHLLVNLGFDIGSPGSAPEFNLIDVENGEIVLTRRQRDGPHDVHVNGIGWLSDSKRFVTAPMDGMIHVWNLQGEVVQEVDIGADQHVEKMCMITGHDKALIVNGENKIEVISFDGQEARYVDLMADRPSALSVSPNGLYLSISMKTNADLCRPAQILIYDLQTLTCLRALEADTYINEKFVIMPSFFGPGGEILCAGSENGKIHFWDVETGELIDVLNEHYKHSGWVTIHPTLQGMMATCSDDNHIILWTTKDLSRALQDEDEQWMESRRTVLPTVDIKKGW